LLIATPLISGLVSLPHGERFSELYILGPERMAQGYPHNIVPNQDYVVYFDVANHVGSSAYYQVYVKFMNASDTLPDATSGVGRSIVPLQEYRFLVRDEHTFEKMITFSISNIAISKNQLTIGNLHLNGEDLTINKVAVWNSTKSEYPYRLVFELWTFNSQSNLFEFNNRFVYLQLNCTGNA